MDGVVTVLSCSLANSVDGRSSWSANVACRRFNEPSCGSSWLSCLGCDALQSPTQRISAAECFRLSRSFTVFRMTINLVVEHIHDRLQIAQADLSGGGFPGEDGHHPRAVVADV